MDNWEAGQENMATIEMVLEEGGEKTMALLYASGEGQPPLFVNWKILLASVEQSQNSICVCVTLKSC